MDLLRIYFIGGALCLIVGLYQFSKAKKQGSSFKFKNLALLFTATGIAILAAGLLLLILGTTAGTAATVVRAIPMATIIVVSAVIIIRDTKKK